MATLAPYEELPHAPLNTPEESHRQEMSTPNVDDMHFVEAVSEALSSGKSDVAVGHPTLVPPNSPEHGFVRGASLDRLGSPARFLPLDKTISPVMHHYPEGGDDEEVDTVEREAGAGNRHEAGITGEGKWVMIPPEVTPFRIRSLRAELIGYRGKLGMVTGADDDAASNSSGHDSQPASPGRGSIYRAQGRPLSTRQQSPTRFAESLVTSIQSLIESLESLPARVAELTQHFVGETDSEEKAKQSGSEDNNPESAQED